MQWDHLTTLRQLHRREGAAACCCCCCLGICGTSVFVVVVGGLKIVDVVSFVASADGGGDNELRLETDPREKNCAENPLSMRGRDNWRCIPLSKIFCGGRKVRTESYSLWAIERNLGSPSTYLCTSVGEGRQWLNALAKGLRCRILYRS